MDPTADTINQSNLIPTDRWIQLIETTQRIKFQMTINKSQIPNPKS